MKYVLLLCTILFGQLQTLEPKTLVLILYSENNPLYPRLKEIWRSYMHRDPEHFECYFLRSDPNLTSDVVIEGDTIWAKGPADHVIPSLLDRTILALEAFQPRLDSFTYVLRTNISSFYVFPRLLNFLQTAPRERLYCGIHHRAKGHPAGWVCGAGIIFSRDTAQLLIDHKPQLFRLSPRNKMNVDDVAIGDLFARLGIPIQTGPFYREIYKVSKWHKMHRDGIPSEVFHFRINTHKGDRLNADSQMHAYLFDRFY